MGRTAPHTSLAPPRTVSWQVPRGELGDLAMLSNPQPRPAACCIVFWDYDTQWGADRSRSPEGARWSGCTEFENTERLLELHAQYEVPACFAVVGAAALPGERPYHDPAQIRRIHANGHEIASHSFHHEWLPGIGRSRLLETLRRSKDALEQCIGAPVVTFVPPFNQPFDHASRGSFSLSERREAGPGRTDLPRLCAALRETGYRVCRVSYRSLPERVRDWFVGGSVDRPVLPEAIAGLTCVRLNTPGGFAEASTAVLSRCVRAGGITLVYGHPHSLHAGNAQDERWLAPFLEQVQRLQRRGLLRVCLPHALRVGD